MGMFRQYHLKFDRAGDFFSEKFEVTEDFRIRLNEDNFGNLGWVIFNSKTLSPTFKGNDLNGRFCIGQRITKNT